MDLGVYCVQGVLYTAGKNPISVSAKEGAKTDVNKFSEVEQAMGFQLHFAYGLTAN